MIVKSEQQIEMIPIEQLVFDPENPRLPQTIRRKKDNKEYESLVIDWMLQFENITELMGSIGEKGFFSAEPLLVVKQNGKNLYEVVEGNRRLTASKLLNFPELANKRKRAIEEIITEANDAVIPKSIPAVIFDKREDILSYLGYKHITGVEAWDSLAKAKYLKQLLGTLPNQDLDEDCRTLAKMIGSKSNYVKLLLIGVDIYNKIEAADFYNIQGLNEESFEFGVFYTALNRSNVAKYVGVDFDSKDPLKKINGQHLEDLTKWIFEENSEGFTRLGESRNLSKLNKVLDEKFPKALVAFRDGGRTLDEASRLTDHPAELFEKSIKDSLFYLEIARGISHEIDKPTDTHSEILMQIFKVAQDMFKLVQSKKTENLISDL